MNNINLYLKSLEATIEITKITIENIERRIKRPYGEGGFAKALKELEEEKIEVIRILKSNDLKDIITRVHWEYNIATISEKQKLFYWMGFEEYKKQ